MRQIDEKIEAEKGRVRAPGREIAALSRRLEVLAVQRSRALDLYVEGTIATKSELAEKLSKVDSEREATQEAIASAKDRSAHIEKWERQKKAAIALYMAFAAQAPWELSPEDRRSSYERIGLRVTASKEGSLKVEITLDPDALPSGEAVDKAWAKVMAQGSITTVEKIPPALADDRPNDSTSVR